MKRYYSTSLFLHLAFIAFAFTLANTEKSSVVEIELTDGQQGDSKEGDTAGSNTNLIELNPGQGEADKELTNFYWGIGINSQQYVEIINDEAVFVSEVTNVTIGYSADTAGLKVGDIIYLINGERIEDGVNDLRGDGPRRMVLTILRKGATIKVQIERVKVYYE